MTDKDSFQVFSVSAFVFSKSQLGISASRLARAASMLVNDVPAFARMTSFRLILNVA